MNELKQFTLKNDYLEVIITNLGASVYQINYLNKPMLATPKNIDDFIVNTQSFGRTVGRTAGRVFKDLETSKYINFNDEDIIKHGGNNKIGEKYFTLVSHTNEKIILNLLVPTFSDSYVGNLNLNVIYELRNNELIIKHEATSDLDTLLRLTFHPYFNLEQSNILNNHSLTINSLKLLETNEKGMFTNAISVDSKNHNYTTKKPLIINDSYHLDDIFLIPDEQIACVLETKHVKMSIQSNYDSLVVYTQNAKATHDLTNTNKGFKYSSIAIETQNAQNKLPLLKANELYNYYTIYKFEKN